MERFYYDDNYRTLLTTRLAIMGNLEACFLTSLCPIFVEAHWALTLPIEWLQQSAKADHKLGMCVYALMLYRSNTSTSNDYIA